MAAAKAKKPAKAKVVKPKVTKETVTTTVVEFKTNDKTTYNQSTLKGYAGPQTVKTGEYGGEVTIKAGEVLIIAGCGEQFTFDASDLKQVVEYLTS